MHGLAPVFTVADALAAGYSAKRLRGAVGRGDLVALRAGTYCTKATLELMSQPADAHALRVAAAQRVLSSPSWASHYTAAQLHLLPLPIGEPSQVTLCMVPGAAPSRRWPGLSVRPAGLPPAQQTVAYGVPATTLARTLVDVSREQGFAAGLVLADAALRRGGTSVAALREVLDTCTGWPGIRAARKVGLHASRRRESPIESRSYALFVARGLPLPECNVWITTGRREEDARGDFVWPEHRVVGEADGRIKYTDPWQRKEPPLWAEKLRMELIEDQDFVVVRWTGRQLEHSPELVIERILRASSRAHTLFGAPLLTAAPLREHRTPPRRAC